MTADECVRRCPLDNRKIGRIALRCSEWDSDLVDASYDLGTISMNGGASGEIPFGNETHRVESYSQGDGCSFRINSRHVSGGAGPGGRPSA
jgi:hypothetical protein